MFHFIVLSPNYFFFDKLNVCDNLASSKSIFPIAFNHFLSLCQILLILMIFQIFSLLMYLLWWSVISDLWHYFCKKVITHWRLRWGVTFLTIIYFYIKAGTLCFWTKYYCILNRLCYSISITFICTWETKKFMVCFIAILFYWDGLDKNL